LENTVRENTTDLLGTQPQPHLLSTPVLVAEDHPVSQTILRSMLTKWGYPVRIARDGVEAWDMLQGPDAPRLAILDWMMPGIDGVEICRRLRTTPCEPYVYVLLLTARAKSEDLVEGMDAGADDYLTKPFDAHELRVRLRAGSRIIALQEQLMRAREELRVQATHDSLTGLLNRAAILEILQSECARANREGQPVALLLIDVDHFKQINDVHGHLAGDAVLREVAARMKSAVRRYDAVGRYGGEEFLIVLPGCGIPSAGAQAERIREAMALTAFDAVSQPVTVTCSIGVSGRALPQLQDGGSLVREADCAMYVAKAHGRNRVELFAPDAPEPGNRDLTNLVNAVVT
jgi:diguanylate cyclase (GGDEF)-like protein